MATEALDSCKKNEEDFPGSEKKTEALDSCKKTKNEEDFPCSGKKRKLQGCDIRVVSSPDQSEVVRCDDDDEDVESPIKKMRNDDSNNNNNNNNEMMIIVHVSNNQTQQKSYGRLKRTARCRQGRSQAFGGPRRN
ncbi:hypothetical protein ABFS82_09G066500 [Erythranthe guttata]